MSDKSIWKKTLNLFVEFDDAQGTPASSSDDLEAILAESQKAMDSLVHSQPVSHVVNSFVSNDDVSEALDKQEEGGVIDFSPLYESVCDSTVSIFKVQEILAQPELANLPRETKAKAAAVALRAMGSGVEEVIRDAYQKDRALDAAELVKRQKAQEKKIANEAQIQAIQKAVDEFLAAKNQEIEQLRKENLTIDSALQEWVQAKLKEEKQIYEIVVHFVSEGETQISLGEVHPQVTEAIPVAAISQEQTES